MGVIAMEVKHHLARASSHGRRPCGHPWGCSGEGVASLRSTCHHIHIANCRSHNALARVRRSLLCGDIEACDILQGGRPLLCINTLSIRALNRTGVSNTGLVVPCITQMALVPCLPLQSLLPSLLPQS
eukprot:4521890-Prymnesium_polylepis.1